MDEIDKLFQKFKEQELILKLPDMERYDVVRQIDLAFNDYTKEEVVAVILEWMLNGRYR